MNPTNQELKAPAKVTKTIQIKKTSTQAAPESKLEEIRRKIRELMEEPSTELNTRYKLDQAYSLLQDPITIDLTSTETMKKEKVATREIIHNSDPWQYMNWEEY